MLEFDSNVDDATTNKSLKKGKPFSQRHNMSNTN